MAVHSVRAREFWHQLEQQKSIDEPDFFQRATPFRSSLKSNELQPLSATLHGPVWASVYCTIRDRNRANRGRSSSASSIHNQRDRILTVSRLRTSPRTTTPSLGKTNCSSKMAENGFELPQKTCNAPKRYETTCYFMPLAVPVWYSSSVSMKINSTKRNYTETVNFQKKLVPYRYVETMTTQTGGEALLYVSENVIDRKMNSGEHYISLESQQKEEIEIEKPFSTNHHITIENHS